MGGKFFGREREDDDMAIIEAIVSGKFLTLTVDVEEAKRERKNEMARAWWASNKKSRAKALRRMHRYYWANPQRERERKRRAYAKDRKADAYS
jgi:hypothetical protein